MEGCSYVQFGTSLLHIRQPRGCNLGRPFCTSGEVTLLRPFVT